MTKNNMLSKTYLSKKKAGCKKILGLMLLSVVFVFFAGGYFLQKQLLDTYYKRESLIVTDRYAREIFMTKNENGFWVRYIDEIPPRFKELLLEKEDKYFYYHFGVNPWSALQAAGHRIGIGSRRASSTITQQLAKILLGKENERNVINKIIELCYAISLETYNSKDDILKMYANSIYFGNQVQGLSEAGKVYFDASPEMMTDGQILQLLAALHSPTENNPAKPQNEKTIPGLAKRLNMSDKEIATSSLSEIKENIKKYSHSDSSYFEIKPLLEPENIDKKLTVDKQLTEKLRDIIGQNIDYLKTKNVNQGAAVIIKLPENEILSLIGSPDPKSFESGNQINILEKPRSIGSTIKPFIYLKSFEKGLRPYSLVDDREYKYITAMGFPLYPKNFDYTYRGTVNLHYALSNSLNVPAVKVLEYVGLETFYNFLENDLSFKPVQSLNNYQLGIALGSLEMNLLDLAKYSTIFPNNGILRDLRIYYDSPPASEKTIADATYVQLINKILNDRKTGIEQFGMKSDLNLFQDNYALKTGTSRDFRDSWIVGFTPDFLVGVWLGNADNSPMDEISGQVGAGKIWSEIMDLLFNSEYNKKTPFDFSLIKEYENGENIEYGLNGDNYGETRNILKDNSLILNPHDGDVFLLEKGSRIILEAAATVRWFVDESFIGESDEEIFTPSSAGTINIMAEDANGNKEEITIYIKKEN